MTVKTYSPGTFCWYELGTRDAKAARKFYTALFGWEAEGHEMPGGTGGTYTLFRVQGQDIAGMYQMDGPHFEGVPANWMTYVWMDDVDAAAKRAKELGATITAPPMDVPGVGRMFMFKDPEGAMLAVFKGGEHPGAARFDELVPGTFCWSELATHDSEAAAGFYTKLFPWKLDRKGEGKNEYTEWIVDGECHVGGMLPIQPEWGPVPALWMNYLTVDDVDGTVKRATELGAKVMVGPMDIPKVGRMAALHDPTGAAFSIIKLNHHD